MIESNIYGNIERLKLFNPIFFIAILFTVIGIWAAASTWQRGLGIWGINDNVTWAIDITNFVFWIGISHAGTFISAILLLLRQEWRTAFNRVAEVMTLISLVCAVLFPLIHTGRQWFSLYWLFPYPNDMGIWINFKSPLIWDFFAISAYFLVSLIFLIVGMMPDFPIIMNRTKNKYMKFIYKKLSFGWLGTIGQWQAYKASYLIIAGLATALVIAVHSIVSYDFAVSIVPGWHFTLLPPYFVVGAVFSGIAMVTVVTRATWKILHFEKKLSESYFDKLGKLLLTFSLLLFFVYIMEIFSGFYKPDSSESKIIIERIMGKGAALFWIILFVNVALPQLLWNKKLRRNSFLFIVAVGVIIGMWLERFMIIYTSLSISFIGTDAINYSPTIYEISLLVGSIGLFLLFYLIFIKNFPVVSIFENHPGLKIKE